MYMVKHDQTRTTRLSSNLHLGVQQTHCAVDYLIWKLNKSTKQGEICLANKKWKQSHHRITSKTPKVEEQRKETVYFQGRTLIRCTCGVLPFFNAFQGIPITTCGRILLQRRRKKIYIYKCISVSTSITMYWGMSQFRLLVKIWLIVNIQ